MTDRHLDVAFAVLDVAPEPYTVSPVLTARVGVATTADVPVHAIALRCQVRIEPLPLLTRDGVLSVALRGEAMGASA